MIKRTAKENIDVIHRFASSVFDSAENSLATIPDTEGNIVSVTYAKANKVMAEQILNLLQREKLEAK